MSCLAMKYPQILHYLESLERETFDHTMLLRYCAILLEKIGMNFLGMNYPVDIICSVFIESYKEIHTVHFRYCAILCYKCILDTLLYCGKK